MNSGTNFASKLQSESCLNRVGAALDFEIPEPIGVNRYYSKKGGTNKQNEEERTGGLR